MTDHYTTAGPGSPPGRAEFTRRVLIVAGVVALATAAGVVLARASDVFFLFFLAVLLAILLRAAAEAVARRSGLAPGRALAVIVLLLAAVLVAGAYGAGSMAAVQFDQLAADFPQALDRARAYLNERTWGRWALQHVPSADELLSGSGGVATRAAAFFSTTFGVLGNVVVLAALTLYLAADPGTYRTGALALVPPGRRARAGQLLDAIGFNLRWWLVGRLAAMAAVGVITAVGLWAVGVPQYLALGLIAGVLTAVPFIGPIAAAVPGVLLALMQGPTTALWALGVYVLAQAVENYLITPLVQQNTVGLPPVVTIVAVVLAGALFGPLALVVATPLAVVVMVAVKLLYVEDVLGDRLNVPGEHPVPETA